MIYKITSKANPLIKDVVKLYESKYRNETGLFICEGFHAYEEAKKHDALEKVFALEEIDSGVDEYLVSKEILDKLTKSKSPQGIVSVCKMPKSKPIKNNKVLFLDGISDPGNMGTLLRTALAFNFLDVIVSKESVSIYNEKVISSTQGAIFQLNIIVGDITLLKSLKAQDYQIISTGLKSSSLIENTLVPSKMVLVLGNESNGVSQEVFDISDSVMKIDMDNIDSLNVGVAGGIAMHLFKEKKKS